MSAKMFTEEELTLMKRKTKAHIAWQILMELFHETHEDKRIRVAALQVALYTDELERTLNQ